MAYQKIKYMYCTSYVLYFLLLVPTVRPLGSGAFGQVFLAQATGIVAFDPRGSTRRKSGRRRSRFGSTSRPYYNDKRVTAVAVKSLKGTPCNIHHYYHHISTATNLKQHLTLQKNWMKFFAVRWCKWTLLLPFEREVSAYAKVCQNLLYPKFTHIE